jgi:6-pyruvoyltetrahydropterin/6-carboxytetrahydropterin synthase
MLPMLPTVRLTRAIEFSTSLRCVHPELSEAENERRYGADARQHGHNYRLEVTLRGVPDPRTGMVIDLKDVQELLDREIMQRFDHRDLNRDTPYFEKTAPTHENFARVIERILLAALPAGALDRIRLQPEADTWVEIVESAPGGSGHPGGGA